jgi:hypothetical protein
LPYQVLLSTLLVSWSSAQLRFCGVRGMGFIPRQLDYCEEILSCQTWELCVLHGGDSKRDDLRSSRPTFSNVTLRTSRSPFSSEPSSCDLDLLVNGVPGPGTDLVVVDVVRCSSGYDLRSLGCPVRNALELSTSSLQGCLSLSGVKEPISTGGDMMSRG